MLKPFLRSIKLKDGIRVNIFVLVQSMEFFVVVDDDDDVCFARLSRNFWSCGFPALLSPSVAVVSSVAVVVLFGCSSCGLFHWVACRSLDLLALWVAV